MMNITIYNNQNIGAEINSANARELHCFLNSGQDYSDWIKNRITQYGFIENQDYIIQIVYTKGRPRKEYFITLDMAKELCMVENNDKGKEARQYFIKCEKELQALKFQHYVDKISALETGSRLEFKHHQNQINGYKGQIAKHNEQIAKLKRELVVSRPEVVYNAEVLQKQEASIESLRAMLHNARCERDYYKKRVDELKKQQNYKDDEITRLLNKIRVQMDGVYSEIGAVMAYCYDNDRFFIDRKDK